MFSLRDVSYTYATAPTGTSRPGVRIDSLDIAATGVTAIIGPSGSGKSTLLSILAGFLVPEIGDGGHLRFDGADVDDGGHPPGRVAFVFQSSMLLGAASGAANMLQGRVAAGDAAAALSIGEASHLIGALGLVAPERNLLPKRARQLSGGEAQRFAVLRALLTGARAILCDEPTSSLDRANADAVMRALGAWSRKTGPVIWVTHDLDLAARYADHFHFLSAGAPHVPDPALTARLASADRDGRHHALLEIAATLGTATSVSPPTGADADPLPRIDRATYAGWIAAALSTDRLRPDADPTTRPHDGEPYDLQHLIARLVPGFATARGRLRHRLRQMALLPLRYSRYSLTAVLTVLLVQVFLAFLFGFAAQRYVRTELQDPAVARVVFEHDVVADAVVRGIGAADPLYAASSLLALREAIAARLSADGVAGDDVARVQVFGRRSVTPSEIRFPGVPGRCGQWLSLDTVALDRDDPLLRQTRLVAAGGVDAAAEALAAIVRSGAERATSADAPALAILEARIADMLRTRCGLAFDAPVPAEWAAIDATGRGRPMALEIAGIAARMPPLYPSPAQLLVLEQDVQRVANRGSAPLDPFRIATAYIPIAGFQATEALLRERNYVIRDDSAAAVAALQQIGAISVWLPNVIIALNLAGCVIIVLLFINWLLELNRRVLALFRSHGFDWRDVNAMMVRHLAPGVVAAIAALVALAAAGWGGLGVLAPGLLVALAPQPVEAALLTCVAAAVVTWGAIRWAVWRWWRTMDGHLPRYLQD